MLASVSVPVDPFGDMSGVGYFPLTNTFTNKSVGYTQYNGTNTSGTYTADGITWASVGAHGFRIPAPNGVSIGEWFQGDQDWAISMVFKMDANAGTAVNRALIHMSNGDDHARPAFWVTDLTEVQELQTKWNGLVVVMDLLGILREEILMLLVLDLPLLLLVPSIMLCLLVVVLMD